jgi:hypothetical protein
LVSGGFSVRNIGSDVEDWIEFRNGNEKIGSGGYSGVTWDIWWEEIESVDGVGIVVDRIGKGDCGFWDGVDRFTIGIVVGSNVGDVGWDIHDCVGRCDRREGASDAIEG